MLVIGVLFVVGIIRFWMLYFKLVIVGVEIIGDWIMLGSDVCWGLNFIYIGYVENVIGNVIKIFLVDDGLVVFYWIIRFDGNFC